MPHAQLTPEPPWLIHLCDAIDALDARKFASYIAPDGLVRLGSGAPARGRPAIETEIRTLFSVVRQLRLERERCWSLPDTLICEGTLSATRLDDEAVTLPFCAVCDLQEGWIGAYRLFADLAPLRAHEEAAL